MTEEPGPDPSSRIEVKGAAVQRVGSDVLGVAVAVLPIVRACGDGEAGVPEGDVPELEARSMVLLWKGVVGTESKQGCEV